MWSHTVQGRAGVEKSRSSETRSEAAVRMVQVSDEAVWTGMK